YFYIVTFQVYNRVAQALRIGATLQEVEQAVLRYIVTAVEVDNKACIEEAIVPYLVFQVLVYEVVMLEYCIVRLKVYLSAVVLCCGNFFVFLCQYASFKFGALHFAVPERCNFEIRAECIHSLSTHTVKTYRLLESLAVVLGARVDLAYHIYHFTQW